MDTRTKPYWYTLINLLKDKKIITTGLTIPYIFRAYEILEKPIKDIPQLMDTILNSNTEKIPIFHMCPEILHIVLLVETKEKCNREFRNYTPLEKVHGQNTLLISPAAASFGKSRERVCMNLIANYGNRIHSKECSWSKRKKEWGEISKEEIVLIESIK